MFYSTDDFTGREFDVLNCHAVLFVGLFSLMAL